MDALLPLAALVGTSGALLFFSNKRKEGYADVVNSSVQKYLPKDHVNYVRKANSKYTDIMNLQNPQRNVLLPPNFKQTDINEAQRKLNAALDAPTLTPKDPSFSLQPRQGRDTNLLNASGKGSATDIIKKCEAVKTDNCNAFDNAQFAKGCGICFTGGENSFGEKVIGGLHIWEEDKLNQEDYAASMGSKVNYQPTVGKCDPNRFVTNKADCIKLKKKLECERNQSFDTEGCAQCLGDNQFQYIEPNTPTTDPFLVLSGNGTLTISKVGSTNATLKTIELTTNAQEVQIPDFKEGDILMLHVNSTTQDASIAGFLKGYTATGYFNLDIIRLIQNDIVTNLKPRLTGTAQVAGDFYSVIRPGRGQTSMKLSLLNVFTFVEPNEEEATSCASSPFITKASSATFLNSGECYKKGQAPGAYSMGCLQQIFTGAGGTTEGTGYPSSTSKATALMNDTKKADGSFSTMGEMAQMLYEKSKQAYTGRDATGQKIPIPQWNEISVYMTGKQITNPCMYDDMDNGPLSAECLNYLWLNSGAADTSYASLGATYTGPTRIASLTGTNTNQYCLSTGTLAPIKNGKEDTVAVKAAQKGGVDAVKAFYNMIHLKANDNTQKDQDRAEAIKQCYGVTLVDTTNPALNFNTQSSYPSVLDNRAGRTKTPFSISTNYDFTRSTNPVFVLGGFGINPWGKTWGGSSAFPDDGAAKWIWNTANAQNGAAGGVTITFVKVYNNPTNVAKTAVLHLVADNNGILSVNNDIMSQTINGYGSATITLLPGNNLIEIRARNTGGPAGLIAICKEGASTLFATDATWQFYI